LDIPKYTAYDTHSSWRGSKRVIPQQEIYCYHFTNYSPVKVIIIYFFLVFDGVVISEAGSQRPFKPVQTQLTPWNRIHLVKITATRLLKAISFTEPKDRLPCSQESVTVPNLELLLIRSFAFVRYWRRNGSTMRQYISYS
jgi:hypothetical protein